MLFRSIVVVCLSLWIGLGDLGLVVVILVLGMFCFPGSLAVWFFLSVGRLETIVRSSYGSTPCIATIFVL